MTDVINRIDRTKWMIAPWRVFSGRDDDEIFEAIGVKVNDEVTTEADQAVQIITGVKDLPF